MYETFAIVLTICKKMKGVPRSQSSLPLQVLHRPFLKSFNKTTAHGADHDVRSLHVYNGVMMIEKGSFNPRWSDKERMYGITHPSIHGRISSVCCHAFARACRHTREVQLPICLAKLFFRWDASLFPDPKVC